MPPTTHTFESPGIDLAPEITARSTRNAYALGLGHIVHNRFADLIRDERDPATIVAGLATTIDVLDNNPQIPRVTEHEEGILRMVERINQELGQREELPDGIDRLRLLRSTVYLVGTLSLRDSEKYNPKRREIRKATIPLVGRIAISVLDDEKLRESFTDVDAHFVLIAGVESPEREMILGRLLEHELLPENARRALGIHPDAMEAKDWGQELLGIGREKAIDVDVGRQGEYDGGLATIDPEEGLVVDTSSFARAELLTELLDAFENHPNNDRPQVIDAFNHILDHEIKRRGVSYQDSLAIFNLRVAHTEVEHQEKDYSRAEAAAKAVDAKLVETATDIAIQFGVEKLRDFLDESPLVSDPDSEAYISFANQIEDIIAGAIEAELDSIGDITPESIILGPASEGTLQLDNDQEKESKAADSPEEAIGFDAEKLGHPVDIVETERQRIRKKLAKVTIDESKIVALDGDHPLRKRYEIADAGTEAEAKIDFLETLLNELVSTPDLVLTRDLAKIEEMVDDKALALHVAYINDNKLLNAVKARFYRLKDYRGVLDLLATIPFRAEGENPLLKEAKSIAEAAQRILAS